jgi:ABC-type microcin C transport system permease subunit YejE
MSAVNGLTVGRIGLAFVVLVKTVLFLVVVGLDAAVVVGLNVGLFSGTLGFFVGSVTGRIGFTVGMWSSSSTLLSLSCIDWNVDK